MANGFYIPWHKVTSGVPQGGVVSPYLFLLYICPQLFRIGHSYADDNRLFCAIQVSNNNGGTTMDLGAQQLDKWAAVNNMQLNEDTKLVDLQICFSKHPPQPAPVVPGGKDVPVATTPKYLGFHLDSGLSGDSHIEQMGKKLPNTSIS